MQVDEEDSEKEKLSLAAIEAIKKAIDLAPNDAHHWCALGVMATMMGSSHYAMSQDAYIRSLKLNENVRTATHASTSADCVLLLKIPHVLYVSCTCFVHVLTFYACYVHVLYIPCTCPVHVMYIPCTCPVHVMYMPCACPVHVLYMSCTHVPTVSTPTESRSVDQSWGALPQG